MRAGKVSGKRPLGLTFPKSTSERAFPTSLPEYQACKIPDTESIHGIDTADPFVDMIIHNRNEKDMLTACMTTMVFGFASAKREIVWF